LSDEAQDAGLEEMLERLFGRWHDPPQLDPIDHPDRADQEKCARYAEAKPYRQRGRQDVGDAGALDHQHAVQNGDLAGQDAELLNEQRAAGRRLGAADVEPTPQMPANVHRVTLSIMPRG